jgi:hypothetical protein
MFGKNSRYFGLETVTGKDQTGTSVQAVKLRRLPDTNGTEMVVTDSSQLDVMSECQYKDATRFWHIADANSEMEANELVETTGRIIKVPKR